MSNNIFFLKVILVFKKLSGAFQIFISNIQWSDRHSILKGLYDSKQLYCDSEDYNFNKNCQFMEVNNL